MDRYFQAQDFAEYCAALTASAIYNVNRKPSAAVLIPDELMLRQRSRIGHYKSAGASGPMRVALPGERPPSSRPPGIKDDVIDRLDRFATRMKQSGGRIN